LPRVLAGKLFIPGVFLPIYHQHNVNPVAKMTTANPQILPLGEVSAGSTISLKKAKNIPISGYLLYEVLSKVCFPPVFKDKLGNIL